MSWEAAPWAGPRVNAARGLSRNLLTAKLRFDRQPADSYGYFFFLPNFTHNRLLA
jgi:hypothetical protein